MKALLALLACACASSASATDYLYDVSMPFSPGTVDNAGWIMTSCDSCTLSSKNIIAWSLTQTNAAMTGFGGAPFTASTMAGSSVVIQGREFFATPTSLSFDFGGRNAYADVLFSSHDHSVHYTNVSDSPLQFGGVLEDCSARLGVCAGSSYSGRETIGSRAGSPVPAPELSSTGKAGALTLLAATLALVLGPTRRGLVPLRARR